MATDTKVPPYPDAPPTSQPGRKPDREDDENRFYDGVTFASDSYVPWVFGKLRLGKCDTSRMQESGCPVLRNHIPDRLVGAVLTVGKLGGLWRSDWRLPKIPANAETFSWLDSGIMRGISVGGRLNLDTLIMDNEKYADKLDEALFTCDWQLVEQSLTGIPADTQATVDRMLADVVQRDAPAVFDTLISPEGIFTTATPDLQRKVEALRQTHNAAILRRREEAMTTASQIPPDILEKAVNERLAGESAVKRLAVLEEANAKLTADLEAESKRNMEARNEFKKIQFQPGGRVLQLDNWTLANDALNIGRILQLTADREMGFPQLDRSTSTLEESFLERQELAAPDRSTVARVPFEAVMERSRQRLIQRTALSDAAGARPSMVNILGDAGLLFNDFAPILAAMDMRMGLRGSQKVPFFTSQGSALGAAEGADIPITTYVMDNTDLLPISIASAFDLSSSLQAADEGTFESLVDFAIFSVCNDEMTAQVLDGGGATANEIAGLWGRVSTATPDHQVEYGAAATDFGRADILTCKNLVDLAKTDGGPGQWVLGTSLYNLAENTLRGGASSERYLLENSMMENRMVHHYADFAPSSVNDPGMFAKLDRCTLLVWGDSFALQEIPVRARKSEYKMVVECNLAVVQPDHNLARIARS